MLTTEEIIQEGFNLGYTSIDNTISVYYKYLDSSKQDINVFILKETEGIYRLRFRERTLTENVESKEHLIILLNEK